MPAVGKIRGGRLAGPQVGPGLLRLFRRRAGTDALSADADASFILGLIQSDAWRTDILRAVRTLNLKDWAIGAGFIRAAVWDYQHGFTDQSPLADIDVVHCDPHRLNPRRDNQLERQLTRVMADVPWSVTNVARMHIKNGERPYRTTEQAIAHWIETPTCVAVHLAADNTLSLLAPHGTGDLLAGVIRPTPAARGKMDVYRARLAAKGWRRRWPILTERQV